MGAKKISQIKAPMQAVVYALGVAVGDQVSAGQEVAVLEAMKMHYEIIAEVDGTVEEVTAVAGNQVAADDVLIEIQQEEAH